MPGDAGAGAERLGETVDAREPAAGDGGAAGQEGRRCLIGEHRGGLGRQRVPPVALPVGQESGGGLLGQPLPQVARRQLILDGTRADLTKLEFDVLQYLYEREGRIVSRAALLRDVWGYDWSGGSNVVEVVISALRRKLGDSAGTLQTVRGAGYRFTAPP